jgi:putative nucleotide binding protein
MNNRGRDRYRRYSKKKSRRRRGPNSYKKKQFIKKERDVVILDLLLHGHIENTKPSWAKKPIAQVLSLPDFVLYEVELNKDADIKVQEKDKYGTFLKQNKLGNVLKKIDYNDLTSTSKALIESIILNAVNDFEELFINFYNKSTSITPRMHALKLLPGIGQKHMWEIIEERERKEFESFEEMAERTSISNPQRQIMLRIIKELERDVKYYLFSRTQKYE